MSKRRTTWRGFFRALDADGEVVNENEILQGGIEYVMELWAGDTNATFETLELENSSNNVIASKSLTISYGLDSTSPPVGLVESKALFSSSEVSSAVEFVVLLDSGGRELARAALSLAAGNAYEIQRQDYIGEAESVT